MRVPTRSCDFPPHGLSVVCALRWGGLHRRLCCLGRDGENSGEFKMADSDLYHRTRLHTGFGLGSKTKS